MNPIATMKTINRRTFVQQSALAATFSITSGLRAASPNDKIVVGVMGLGGRGSFLTESFAKRPDVEIAWLCDPDQRRLTPARAMVERVQGRAPKVGQDFRRILEDTRVQVLINATPDHWHGLGTILACQAGKDVYVEKPLAHNAWEGRQMVEAARRYQRVVQVGTQSRSSPYAREAAEYVRSGKLGDIYLVRVFNMMQHAFQKPVPDQAAPETLDYDMWCGPAAKRPYNPRRYWLNYFEYSCGPIPGDLVHQLDLARFVLGDPASPTSVAHSGGIRSLTDGRDTPDTQLATFDYGKLTLMFESTLWTPYMKKVPMELRDRDQFANWPFEGTRIEICGTKGFMFLGRHGGGWQVFYENQQPSDSKYGRQGDKWHIENFLDCVRTRQRPNSDVEQVHYSTLLCHLANASFRVGNKQLAFDAKTEQFPENPAANAFLKRAYRSPWIVPEKV